jgi:hypothetical protein
VEAALRHVNAKAVPPSRRFGLGGGFVCCCWERTLCLGGMGNGKNAVRLI